MQEAREEIEEMVGVMNRWANFGMWIAPKCVRGRDPPGPAGGAIALPQTS